MSVLTKNYQDSLLGRLQNPAEAEAYLDAALEDEDSRVFLLALRDVAEARGIANVAADVDPRLSNLKTLLHTFGLRLAVRGSAK